MTFLSPLSGETKPTLVPAHSGFRGIEGQVMFPEVGKEWVGLGAQSAAQKAGLRYEEKAQAFLRSKFPDVRLSTMLHFCDDSGPRRCVPDAFLSLPDRTIAFEIKSQHMPESWWQLRKLYAPVLEALYSKPVLCVEMTKSYDPAVPFPELHQVFYNPDSLAGMPVSSFVVLLWKK